MGFDPEAPVDFGPVEEPGRRTVEPETAEELEPMDFGLDQAFKKFPSGSRKVWYTALGSHKRNRLHPALAPRGEAGEQPRFKSHPERDYVLFVRTFTKESK